MCPRPEARASPWNGRILGPVLAVDEQTVTFDDRNRETVSGCAILRPVDNCEHVDKVWARATREVARRAHQGQLRPAIELVREMISLGVAILTPVEQRIIRTLDGTLHDEVVQRRAFAVGHRPPP